ncbi:ABC transporter ATP-binding protein [Pelodictyon luteolum]|uniref:ATPase n=1 Tax=Chlorobium luteolum (strain DSM 273 / BCRC 81028 / 2530) TaxID=319225 RepID=Q3B265_CHLL3|nr:ABC transporter ATP-binding protein [Pelodictyon luteolum]ABB24566.1 ATPase [Pelodictyon luteolum DSM 273]
MIRIQIEKTLSGAEGPFVLSLDLCLRPGSFNCIYGPSGSGKTTLLRILSGLDVPDRGFIEVNGCRWFDAETGINRPPQERRVGFVFQDYALFPTMTVRENLGFAQQKKDRGKIDDILELTGLTALSNRLPRTLSGGQQQRVALARSILREPDILLLDEPLSALDEDTRRRLQDEIRNYHTRFALTTLLVSHDRQEVFRLADTVHVLERGRVVRHGSPMEAFLGRITSSRFSFIGTILSIRSADCIHLAVIAAGNELVEVVLSRSDTQTLHPGDQVLVASKAFNPIIRKLQPHDPAPPTF